MPLFVGCPIWSFKGWVGNFYPEGTQPSDYLHEYARRLTTIEGNTTFYAAPGPKALERWIAETPDSFRFCPKIPQAISHAGPLVQRLQSAHEFVETMSHLAGRLGPIFLQLPPRYSPRMIDDLELFLEAWPPEVRLAVEVRHPDWFDAEHDAALDRLLASHHMARVVIDTRPIRTLDGDHMLAGSVYQTLLEARRHKPDVPVTPKQTAAFSFLRYIGHPALEVNAPFVAEWAAYLAARLRERSEAFVFCHAPDNLVAPVLCREFHSSVARQVPIPPLPWDDVRSNASEQPPLF